MKTIAAIKNKVLAVLLIAVSMVTIIQLAKPYAYTNQSGIYHTVLTQHEAFAPLQLGCHENN